jgi:hypothetical protein
MQLPLAAVGDSACMATVHLKQSKYLVSLHGDTRPNVLARPGLIPCLQTTFTTGTQPHTHAAHPRITLTPFPYVIAQPHSNNSNYALNLQGELQPAPAPSDISAAASRSPLIDRRYPSLSKLTGKLIAADRPGKLGGLHSPKPAIPSNPPYAAASGIAVLAITAAAAAVLISGLAATLLLHATGPKPMRAASAALKLFVPLQSLPAGAAAAAADTGGGANMAAGSCSGGGSTRPLRRPVAAPAPAAAMAATATVGAAPNPTLLVMPLLRAAAAPPPPLLVAPLLLLLLLLPGTLYGVRWLRFLKKAEMLALSMP